MDTKNLRFYDLIMRSSKVTGEIKDALDGVIVLDGSNVAEYYFAETDQEIWGMSDFPNIAPPFADFWLDFHAPDQVISRELGVLTWAQTKYPLHWGFRCQGVELSSEENVSAFLQPLWGEAYNEFAQRVGDARWGMDLWMGWNLGRGEFVLPIWYWKLLVDGSGQALFNQSGEIVMVSDPVNLRLAPTDHLQGQVPQHTEDEVFQKWYDAMLPLLHCGFLTLSFLHCRNVILTDVTPPVMISHNNARRRAGERSYRPVPYKVLDIHPMRQILEKEGQSDKLGMKKALHICRGHFKRYENGRGLFGKLHGTYFFPQQVRGAKEQGVITKDYRIFRPEKD